MSRINKAARASDAYMGTKVTHAGGQAYQTTTALQDLKRSVMSCLLWEDTFYESGEDHATRISRLAAMVKPEALAKMAVEARSRYNLRHVPLLLLRTLVKTGAGEPGLVSKAIYDVIQRPDEINEFVALYWQSGKKPLTGQMKKGLARSFEKFSEYSLAKYNGPAKVRLRDVLFLTRPKPKTIEQAALWKRLADNELATPDTWEVALSAGADKGATFTRLLNDTLNGTGKGLGYLALLRNLRNMEQAGVDPELVNTAIVTRKGGAERVLPFRYVAAARAAPRYERALDKALLATINESEQLSGSTIVLVDVSGSMDSKLSGKSDLTRMDAACTLAAMIPGDNVRVFSFSNNVVEVPARLGMAGVDAIRRSQGHGGTLLGNAIKYVNQFAHDRLIVITDEQTSDAMVVPKAKKAYMINVAGYKNGVGYGQQWQRIDGFSERVLHWIREIEEV